MFLEFVLFLSTGTNFIDGFPSYILGPEQVHLSYTGDQSSMFVTWVTNLYLGEGTVHFTSALPYVADGESTYSVVNATTYVVPHYSDDENMEEQTVLRTSFTFRATIEGLSEGSEYQYYVQNGELKSSLYTFKTFPTNEGFKPTIAVYGDMGCKNDRALNKLIEDANAKKYDIVWHIGDIAYDMHELAGGRGDLFMNLIQPIAAYIPYSVIPGNHEWRSNFSEYRNKFTSPAPNVFFHSYNIGPIHLVMFNTEFYIFTQFGTDQIQTQYNWLVEDLKRANEPTNREAQPWIVAAGHRPMYCSEVDPEDCQPNNQIRLGLNYTEYGLEPLFYKYGVDLMFFGHEHNYERMFPIYNYTYQIYEENPDNYVDPKYPVHVISGSAGNRENHSDFQSTEPEWSFMRAQDYGFAYLTVRDKLTLDISQYSIDQGHFIDHFTVKKSQNYPNFA